MSIEIERKYLVNSRAYRVKAERAYRIIQGFLNKDPHRTVRIRLLDDRGTLTVKGLSSEDGTTRFEWETDLTKHEAESLLQLCENGIIDKTRYEIPNGDLLFAVDEFHGDNQGLVIAEVELPEVTKPVELPDWIGKEVTGDSRYYNSSLSNSPFGNWT